jgi:hypothetical protein
VFGISVRTLFEQPNVDHVRNFLNRGGTARVVLADPRDRHSMAQYEKDFDSAQGDRSKKVINILANIDEVRSKLDTPENLQIRVSPHYFKYSAYGIDGDVLFVPYRLTPGKTIQICQVSCSKNQGVLSSAFLRAIWKSYSTVQFHLRAKCEIQF